ncbi:MAG: hypothetical protein MRQ09_00580 [Candidatus Midichloria sp.]|nr:hypothetical protein [Candidatus Midichloria sp.]
MLNTAENFKNQDILNRERLRAAIIELILTKAGMTKEGIEQAIKNSQVYKELELQVMRF